VKEKDIRARWPVVLVRGFLLVDCAIFAWRTWQLRSNLRRSIPVAESFSDERSAVVIPVVDAPETARKSFDYFASLNIRPVYAVWAKDAESDPTVQVLREIGANIVLLVGGAPNKARQLRECISVVSRHSIFIYDVDSRPTSVGDLPDGICCGQQMSIYFSSRGLWQGVADRQTFWALSGEASWLRRPMHYLVGHGLGLSNEHIEHHGFFREDAWSEDLDTGYEASRMGCKTAQLKGIDRVTYPYSWISYSRLGRRWWCGDASALLKHVAKAPSALAAVRGSEVLWWATRGALYTTLALLCWTHRRGRLCGELAVAEAVRAIVGVRLANDAIVRENGENSNASFWLRVIGFLLKPYLDSVWSIQLAASVVSGNLGRLRFQRSDHT
jgi:hypothetical protein